MNIDTMGGVESSPSHSGNRNGNGNNGRPVVQQLAYSNNIYEMVIKVSSELETFLETEFGAVGRGLHEKITSVESQLTPALVKRMRYLATIRNKLIHQKNSTDIPDRNSFIRAFEASKTELKTIVDRKRGMMNQRRGGGREHNNECMIL